MAESTGSPSEPYTGSTGGSPTYTEAQLQEHVGKAQSTLARQLAATLAEAEAAKRALDTAKQEVEEFRKAASAGGTRVSDLAKEKELAQREAAIATKELEVMRVTTATDLGVDVSTLADFTAEQLKTAKLMKQFFGGGKPTAASPTPPDPQVKPNRGDGTEAGRSGTSSVASIAAQGLESLKFIRRVNSLNKEIA